MTLNQKVLDMLKVSDEQAQGNLPSLLNQKLRLLSKWRSVLIQNTVIERDGTSVIGGPFIGMKFIKSSAEGCHVAKLLGCYEQPIHKIIDQIPNKGYENIINIGCAEGYYAVGLALNCPDSKIWAFDLDENATKVCKSLAQLNNVEEQIEINKEFTSNDFQKFTGTKTLILCDIEGAERELFADNILEATKSFDMIIESHECLVPGVTELLVNRFEQTHLIEKIDDDGMRSFGNLPDWFKSLSHLDQLLAVWEWRAGPTPWLILEATR